MKLFGTSRNAAHLQKKKRRWVLPVVIFLALCLIAVGVLYFLIQRHVRPPDVLPFVPPPVSQNGPSSPNLDDRPDADEEDPRPSGIYTVLIIGEENSGGGRSDSLILAAVDTKNSELTMLNIPRDLMVRQHTRINAILPAYGVDGLLAEVEQLVGFMPDNHIIVDLDAFESLVDVIGPIYFNVPMRMVYDDPERDRIVHIRLEPGYQYLNGENALNVFRFRQNNDGTGYMFGDIDRIRTQQNLLRVIASDLLQIRNVTRVHELANIFMDYVETDLPIGSLIFYALELMDMDSDEINFMTLPGNYDYWRNGASYVLVELEEWLEVINTYLNPFPLAVTEQNIRILGYRDGVFQTIGDGLTLTPRQP